MKNILRLANKFEKIAMEEYDEVDMDELNQMYLNLQDKFNNLDKHVPKDIANTEKYKHYKDLINKEIDNKNISGLKTLIINFYQVIKNIFKSFNDKLEMEGSYDYYEDEGCLDYYANEIYSNFKNIINFDENLRTKYDFINERDKVNNYENISNEDLESENRFYKEDIIDKKRKEIPAELYSEKDEDEEEAEADEKYKSDPDSGLDPNNDYDLHEDWKHRIYDRKPGERKANSALNHILKLASKFERKYLGISRDDGDEIIREAGSAKKKNPGIAKKSDPKLWARCKSEAKSKMGGKHSARAMQLALKLYKSRGGRFIGPKGTAKTNKLKQWSKKNT